MDDGGSSKRPFGPHGEDCTCDWDEEEDREELSLEEQFLSRTDPISPEERAYARHLDIVLSSMAQCFVEHFLVGLDQCSAGSVGLNRRQVVHMMSAIMTGYNEAVETGKVIEESLRSYAIQARKERKAREKEEPPELHDVSDIFTVPPGPFDQDGQDDGQ